MPWRALWGMQGRFGRAGMPRRGLWGAQTRFGRVGMPTHAAAALRMRSATSRRRRGCEALLSMRENGGRTPTTFIISHRITTLADADLILVLEDGRIAQQGTHSQLIETDGLYRRVYRIQAALEDELSRETA